MKSVRLIGRLATDVEVKEVNGGSKVSSFILAVDSNAEEADFFRIKAWNSQAEAAGASRHLSPELHGLPVTAICQARARAFRSCSHRPPPAKRNKEQYPGTVRDLTSVVDSDVLSSVQQPEAPDATGP